MTQAPAADVLMAFDRASVRSFDADGRLHVATANISKAAINPYRGEEIPGWEELGLDPQKVYRLYRDPEELERAAPTFNNLPLLSRHVPVSAADHQPDLIVGSTGTDAAFRAPFLCNSLVVWAQPSIDAIRSDEQRELSSAYRYRADMTPGSVGGESYDGVMRDIIGNHVALVREGRAGPDVVVGDHQLEIHMANKPLSRMATYTLGALSAYLRPKLAQDAKVDLSDALGKVNRKNFAGRKAAIVTALKAQTEGKLAADADLDDLVGLLDAIGEVPVAEVADEDPNSAVPPVMKPAEDGSVLDRLKEFLKGKISDEDLAQIDGLFSAEAADEDGAEKDNSAKPDGMIDKAAMDAAIANATKTAADNATRIQREIRDAERAVRPYVGELAVAQDSAEGVYRTALGILGVKIDGVHASALPTILSMQPVPGAKAKREPVAMDAAAGKSFADMFPHAAKLARG